MWEKLSILILFQAEKFPVLILLDVKESLQNFYFFFWSSTSDKVNFYILLKKTSKSNWNILKVKKKQLKLKNVRVEKLSRNVW